MHVDPAERNFFIIGAALLVVFFVVLTISSVAYGIQLPAPEMRIDPRTINDPEASPFGLPVDERLRELAPGKYEVYMTGQAWAFQPAEIRIPAGSTLTIYATSKDVQHGFKLQGTNLNFMILPGQISKQTGTFDEPGEYTFICHEYCGVAHHVMFGKIIVEE